MTTLEPPTTRTTLPLAAHAVGKRSAVTCQFKCANACMSPECNASDNPTFRSIAEHALSRRALLGAAAAGAIVVATDAFGVLNPAPASAATGGLVDATRGWGGGSLPFQPIAPVAASVDAFTVPKGYTWSPIIRWGDPLFSDAPAFSLDAQSPAAQARQFGYNSDYLDILADRGGKTGVLVNNHEYVNPNIMFAPTTDAAELRRRGDVYKAAQGLSVVEITRRRRGTPWRYVVDGKRNRRITVETVFELTGPAAGSDLVKTAADREGRWVHGTLGNCAGGTTPWGTILSGEENFNGYFAWATDTSGQKRYQATASRTTSTGWEQYDPRFNAHDPGYVNEPNRFGYIVEIDPDDPTSTPVKHTAMGRFKHEGANVIVARDRRVVAYMGDDERNDYLYKFVSKHKVTGSRKKNMRLLAEGDLFVARFRGDSPASQIDGSGMLPSDGAFDGTGEWVALTRGGKSAVPGMTVEEVLVYTRLAADKVGATKMDRPEDVEPDPRTGKVYVALTNNTDRGKTSMVDEANPRTGNRYGHVIELTERGGQTGTSFGWSILLQCGNPSDPSTYFAGYPKDKVSPISCPDNLAFDEDGNLWISTDGAPSTIGFNDGLFRVPLRGRDRGRVEQFLAVPREAETCGPVIRAREQMVFVAVQHPGENGTVAAPTSLFPDYGSTRPGDVPNAPRPSVVQVYRA
ncbi:PhoX family phosphatase [Microbacterium sp. EYE_5]|nr:MULTISPECIES: PhoX family phosphatase [unclassified Microbacterium]MCK6080050.1 PhoX family phosphatase [Microbacterium sp. EYE_382]MCK6085321.1 PhoX family phosphatase [Microbacterium sp. EYE_384]MCK6122454.1 PhoX family phosphatase [Microbacterium sp. EYE_80]MCK6126084.1 PhoX family phosphatase [Microbacterium sp. EYE_79]MCK6141005.1 PhoX family phosphatase [Microbacterium sp. EYE_39]